jgi:curved DNA-binding protein CbpA
MTFDLYEILEVSPTASYDEMKDKYRKLLLKVSSIRVIYLEFQYHPDKASAANSESVSSFHRLQDAWNILSNDKLRRKYDNSAQNDARLNSNASVSVEVSIDEMDFTTDTYGTITVSYSCRCGGKYQLNEKDMSNSQVLIQCSACSFFAKVNLDL